MSTLYNIAYNIGIIASYFWLAEQGIKLLKHTTK